MWQLHEIKRLLNLAGCVTSIALADMYMLQEERILCRGIVTYI
jgi:hypothetical protein